MSGGDSLDALLYAALTATEGPSPFRVFYAYQLARIQDRALWRLFRPFEGLGDRDKIADMTDTNSDEAHNRALAAIANTALLPKQAEELTRALRDIVLPLDAAIEKIADATDKGARIATARAQVAKLWSICDLFTRIANTVLPTAPTLDLRKTPEDGSMDPDVLHVLENALQVATSPHRETNPITGVMVCLAFKEPIEIADGTGDKTPALPLIVVQDRGLETLAQQVAAAATALGRNVDRQDPTIHARATVRVKGLTNAVGSGLVVELDRVDGHSRGIASMFGNRFTVPATEAEQKALSARFGETVELVIRDPR